MLHFSRSPTKTFPFSYFPLPFSFFISLSIFLSLHLSFYFTCLLLFTLPSFLRLSLSFTFSLSPFSPFRLASSLPFPSFVSPLIDPSSHLPFTPTSSLLLSIQLLSFPSSSIDSPYICLLTLAFFLSISYPSLSLSSLRPSFISIYYSFPSFQLPSLTFSS